MPIRRPPLSSALRDVIEADIASAAAHPFFGGLLEGTLPHDVFGRFLEVDAHFLVRQARNITRLAARFDGLLHGLLASIGAGLVQLPETVYAPFFGATGTSLESSLRQPLSPLCEAYLRASAGFAAEGTPLEALAFFTTVFIHHREVGERMRSAPPSPDGTYALWLASWGGDDGFAHVLGLLADALDELAEEADDGAYARALEAASLCSHLDLLFWDEQMPASARAMRPAFPPDLFVSRGRPATRS